MASPSGKETSFADGRLVVMVNQYSASASEITSGAVQDWDRGVIVGRRTFGKGLVQRPVPFPDGSMIRLTVAHYYTPTGRDIQKPYSKGGQKEYAKDIIDRFNHGELMHEDSVKYVDSLRVQTLVNKRPIYGGGGISPTVSWLSTPQRTRSITAKSWPRDSSTSSASNTLTITAKQIKKLYKTDADFVRGFEVSDAMIQELKEMADKEGIEYDEEQAKRSRPLFAMIIKALIGRDIYENATYFKVYNGYDPIFREALRLINSPEYDAILDGSYKKN